MFASVAGVVNAGVVLLSVLLLFVVDAVVGVAVVAVMVSPVGGGVILVDHGAVQQCGLVPAGPPPPPALPRKQLTHCTPAQCC